MDRHMKYNDSCLKKAGLDPNKVYRLKRSPRKQDFFNLTRVAIPDLRVKAHRPNTIFPDQIWVYPVGREREGLVLVPIDDLVEVKAAKPSRKRVATTAKNLTLRNLENAEDLFLRANGWRKARDGQYRPPAGYSTASVSPGGTYTRTHAVNSQRKHLEGT